MSIDVGQITTLVNTVGFPIVMCLLLFYYIYSSNKQLVNAVNALENSVIELKSLVEKGEE